MRNKDQEIELVSILRTSYLSELSYNEIDYLGDNVFHVKRNVKGEFQFLGCYVMDLSTCWEVRKKNVLYSMSEFFGGNSHFMGAREDLGIMFTFLYISI